MVAGWLLGGCWVAAVLIISELSSSFFKETNDGVLRRRRWMRKRVTTGIQLPLSGLVVRGTDHLTAVESSSIMTQWHGLKQEIHIISSFLFAIKRVTKRHELKNMLETENLNMSSSVNVLVTILGPQEHTCCTLM